MLRSGGETMHGGLQQQVMESCAGCHLPIVDRFLLNVGDRPWHEDCVQCSVCRCPLNERCFFKEGKLYCRDDFYKNFGTKCAGCSHGISPTALIRRSREKVFHLECFTCLVCRRQLSTGDELFLNDDDTIVCKQDYGHKKLHSAEESAHHHLHLQENQVVSLSDGGRPKDVALESRLPAPDVPTSTGNSPTPHAAAAAGAGAEQPELKQEMDVSDCESVVSNCSYYSSTPSANNNNTEKENDKAKDGSTGGEMTAGVGAKRRGPRTTIKVKQLETLKAAFAATPKPTRHIREQLARDTGLSMRVIQVWFQNRRSKERRMKQLNVLGARRQFFRSPRRMRSFRPGDHDSIDDSQLMPPNGFPYFPDGVVVAGGDFYHPAFMNYNSYIEQMSVPPPPHQPPSMSLHEGSFLQASNGTTDRSLAGLDPSVVGGDVSRSQDAACHHFGGPPPPLPPPPPSTPTLHALRMHHSGMMSLHAAPNGPNPFAQQHLDKPWPACL